MDFLETEIFSSASNIRLTFPDLEKHRLQCETPIWDPFVRNLLLVRAVVS